MLNKHNKNLWTSLLTSSLIISFYIIDDVVQDVNFIYTRLTFKLWFKYINFYYSNNCCSMTTTSAALNKATYKALQSRLNYYWLILIHKSLSNKSNKSMPLLTLREKMCKMRYKPQLFWKNYYNICCKNCFILKRLYWEDKIL